MLTQRESMGIKGVPLGKKLSLYPSPFQSCIMVPCDMHHGSVAQPIHVAMKYGGGVYVLAQGSYKPQRGDPR